MTDLIRYWFIGVYTVLLRTFAAGCHDQTDAPPGTPPELLGTRGPNDCAEIQFAVHNPYVNN